MRCLQSPVKICEIQWMALTWIALTCGAWYRWNYCIFEIARAIFLPRNIPFRGTVLNLSDYGILVGMLVEILMDKMKKHW